MPTEQLQSAGEVFTYRLFSLGGTPVTLLSIIVFAGASMVFAQFARFAGRGVSQAMLRRADLDQGTTYALGRVVQYLILIIGFIVSFQFLGIDLSSVTILLGALGVGIGLGLQNLTSNFVSGIILLLERPVKVGDRITIGETEGDVVAINMRATTVRTPRNVAIIVPNSQLVSSEVVNWSAGDPKLGIAVDVGVSYNSDLDLVMETLLAVARQTPLVLQEPEAVVRFLSFGESSWDLRLFCWIGNAKEHFKATSDLRVGIARSFRAAGIEIPYPQRDINFRNPLATQVNGQRQAEHEDDAPAETAHGGSKSAMDDHHP